MHSNTHTHARVHAETFMNLICKIPNREEIASFAPSLKQLNIIKFLHIPPISTSLIFKERSSNSLLSLFSKIISKESLSHEYLAVGNTGEGFPLKRINQHSYLKNIYKKYGFCYQFPVVVKPSFEKDA